MKWNPEPGTGIATSRQWLQISGTSQTLQEYDGGRRDRFPTADRIDTLVGLRPDAHRVARGTNKLGDALADRFAMRCEARLFGVDRHIQVAHPPASLTHTRYDRPHQFGAGNAAIAFIRIRKQLSD